jgi:hypothetical protein
MKILITGIVIFCLKISVNAQLRELSSINPDTIDYLLYDDFETWGNKHVNTLDGLMSKWQINTGATKFARQSIVNVPGYGNVWRSTVLENEWQSLELQVSLADTTSELWMDYDYYADPNFNHKGKGGGYSGKMLLGFYAGDNKSHAELPDTTTSFGRAGWIHHVWGSSGQLMGYRRDQIYNYHACGMCGTILIPKGYWIHVTHHVKINDPGLTNGFYETYLNGVLKTKVTGLRFRSASQGVDYGKIESIILAYFFGGEQSIVYASPRTQYVQMDNLVVYKYKPGAANFGIRERNIGDSVSQIIPPGTSYSPPELLTDEVYTNASDTIYDVGNDKPYIYWPPFKKSIITKEVMIPAGTINYLFLVSQFGYPNYGIGCEMYVKVYSGTGAKKILVRTHGRKGMNNGRDPRYVYPVGEYRIKSNTATFEIYSGCNGGISRGVAIRYSQSVE